MLRDSLSDKYRSSSKSKLARRKKAKQDSLTKGGSVVDTILEINSSRESSSQVQLKQRESELDLKKKALCLQNQKAIPELKGNVSRPIVRNSCDITPSKNDQEVFQQESQEKMNSSMVRKRQPAGNFHGGFHDVDNGRNLYDMPW